MWDSAFIILMNDYGQHKLRGKKINQIGFMDCEMWLKMPYIKKNCHMMYMSSYILIVIRVDSGFHYLSYAKKFIQKWFIELKLS
jgi:hypothetical protein